MDSTTFFYNKPTRLISPKILLDSVRQGDDTICLTGMIRYLNMTAVCLTNWTNWNAKIYTTSESRYPLEEALKTDEVVQIFGASKITTVQNGSFDLICELNEYSYVNIVINQNKQLAVEIPKNPVEHNLDYYRLPSLSVDTVYVSDIPRRFPIDKHVIKHVCGYVGMKFTFVPDDYYVNHNIHPYLGTLTDGYWKLPVRIIIDQHLLTPNIFTGMPVRLTGHVIDDPYCPGSVCLLVGSVKDIQILNVQPMPRDLILMGFNSIVLGQSLYDN